MNTMSAVQRILDANINRAAEGMRVLEDISRFKLNNQELSTKIKSCRHALRSVKTSTEFRDVANDVGTTISTPQEGCRNSMHDIATAAGNRCAEALRVIEEFLKLSDNQSEIEQIRYEMYDHCAKILHLLGASIKKQWNVCFVMTVDDCLLAWQDTLIQSLVAGCDCVQVREKYMSTAQLITHVRKVKEIADTHGVQVIVNDRVDVYLATKVAGVHLGENDMSLPDARKLCGTECIIGATAHTTSMSKELIAQGADYIGVGAMFNSPTKPDVKVASLSLLKNVLAYNHLAIGGITPKNVHELYNEGCKGVAISSAIANSPTPEKVVAKILQPEHQSV
ncbi:MAG TPA: thiamine phosphate synthase [Phycisphaerales bacterium]|nr:thiamine phosphate synthase [Phycisphaerales bacterium]